VQEPPGHLITGSKEKGKAIGGSGKGRGMSPYVLHGIFHEDLKTLETRTQPNPDEASEMKTGHAYESFGTEYRVVSSADYEEHRHIHIERTSSETGSTELVLELPVTNNSGFCGLMVPISSNYNSTESEEEMVHTRTHTPLHTCTHTYTHPYTSNTDGQELEQKIEQEIESDDDAPTELASAAPTESTSSQYALAVLKAARGQMPLVLEATCEAGSRKEYSLYGCRDRASAHKLHESASTLLTTDSSRPGTKTTAGGSTSPEAEEADEETESEEEMVHTRTHTPLHTCTHTYTHPYTSNTDGQELEQEIESDDEAPTELASAAPTESTSSREALEQELLSRSGGLREPPDIGMDRELCGLHYGEQPMAREVICKAVMIAQGLSKGGVLPWAMYDEKPWLDLIDIDMLSWKGNSLQHIYKFHPKQWDQDFYARYEIDSGSDLMLTAISYVEKLLWRMPYQIDQNDQNLPARLRALATYCTAWDAIKLVALGKREDVRIFKAKKRRQVFPNTFRTTMEQYASELEAIARQPAAERDEWPTPSLLESPKLLVASSARKEPIVQELASDSKDLPTIKQGVSLTPGYWKVLGPCKLTRESKDRVDAWPEGKNAGNSEEGNFLAFLFDKQNGLDFQHTSRQAHVRDPALSAFELLKDNESQLLFTGKTTFHCILVLSDGSIYEPMRRWRHTRSNIWGAHSNGRQLKLDYLALTGKRFNDENPIFRNGPAQEDGTVDCMFYALHYKHTLGGTLDFGSASKPWARLELRRRLKTFVYQSERFLEDPSLSPSTSSLECVSPSVSLSLSPQAQQQPHPPSSSSSASPTPPPSHSPIAKQDDQRFAPKDPYKTPKVIGWQHDMNLSAFTRVMELVEGKTWNNTNTWCNTREDLSYTSDEIGGSLLLSYQEPGPRTWYFDSQLIREEVAEFVLQDTELRPAAMAQIALDPQKIYCSKEELEAAQNDAYRRYSKHSWTDQPEITATLKILGISNVMIFSHGAPAGSSKPATLKFAQLEGDRNTPILMLLQSDEHDARRQHYSLAIWAAQIDLLAVCMQELYDSFGITCHSNPQSIMVCIDETPIEVHLFSPRGDGSCFYSAVKLFCRCVERMKGIEQNAQQQQDGANDADDSLEPKNLTSVLEGIDQNAQQQQDGANDADDSLEPKNLTSVLKGIDQNAQQQQDGTNDADDSLDSALVSDLDILVKRGIRQTTWEAPTRTGHLGENQGMNQEMQLEGQVQLLILPLLTLR